MDNKLNLPFLDTPDPERFIKNAAKFSDLMMMYRCTIRELQTKLEVLNDEFSIENKRNPISFIKTRVKKPESIYRKLQKLGYEFSAENIQEQLNDVAGIRWSVHSLTIFIRLQICWPARMISKYCRSRII